MNKTIIKTILATAFAMLSCSMNAYDIKIDGIYYDITSESEKTCGVTYKDINMNSYSGSIEIPSTITYNSKKYTVTSVENSAFQRCTNLVSITLPNTITEIDATAFHSCSSIKTITLPSQIDKINDYTFYGCSSLESITMPSKLKSIGKSAFELCVSLKSITVPDNVTIIDNYSFAFCSSIENVQLNSNLSAIGSYSFTGCKSLKTINIPTNVFSIGNGAFDRCNSLTSITTDKNSIFYGSKDGILYSKDMTILFRCPEGKVGTCTIPSVTNTIKASAFKNCLKITGITIPNSVTTIGEEAFQGCSSIKTIKIPNSITSIPEYAFDGCNSLESVKIPNSVTNISYGAFRGCSSLKDIFNMSITPQYLQSYTFDKYGTLHVLEGYKGIYNQSSIWSQFNIIDDLDNNIYIYDSENQYSNNTLSQYSNIYYIRTFNNTNWQALYLPFTMSYDDWKDDFDIARINAFYEYDTDDDGVIDKQVMEIFKIKEGNGNLKPNVPYLIKAKTTGEKTITLKHATIFNTEEQSFDCSTMETKYIFTGTYERVTNLKSSGYYFMSGGALKTASNDDVSLGAFRWYMKVENKCAMLDRPNEINIRIVNDDDIESNIQETYMTSSECSNDIYTIDGRKVSNVAKEQLKPGLYIINNRKIYIK